MAKKFADLHFSNRFYKELNYLFATIKPTPLKDPKLVHLNSMMMQDLELSLDQKDTPSFLRFLNADLSFDGVINASSVYSGHQFGHYVPQLGDGRAMFLGEVQTEHNGFFELQLKGAGLTPFSRRGDGKAVYRSSVREYLASSHLKALGIATTEALALISGEGEVFREDIEKEAMVLRVSPSFIRFGHFEFLYHGGYKKELNELIEFTINSYYPEIAEHENRHVLFLQTVIKKTAKLFADWQAVGFCHGVLNTDNMSILGLTLDYGPYGFIDEFNQDFICNSSDYEGRYSLGNQPGIGMWNLGQLSNALADFISEEDRVRTLETYVPLFLYEYRKNLLEKCGLFKLQAEDESFLKELLNVLVESEVDYTSFFRALSSFSTQNNLLSGFEGNKAITHWLDQYKKRLLLEETSEEVRLERMKAVNPKFILRNYLAQKCIDGEINISDLYEVLSHPYEEWEGFHEWSKPASGALKGLKVSCSS